MSKPAREVIVIKKGESVTAFSAALLLASASGGCAVAPGEEPLGEAQQAALSYNGVHLNGLHVNGLHVNGLHVNGLHVNGTTLDGIPASGVTLDKTSFSGVVDGAPRSGLGFIGAQMSATLNDGTAVLLRIDDIEPSRDPEILLYDVSATTDGENWAPLCTDLNGAPVHSYPVSGYWDESQGTRTGGDHILDPDEFTFACEGYAIAKCADMGYKPWASVTECRDDGRCHELPLWMHHEACTRMLRADYCGDGTATTRDGTLIDVADDIGLERETMPNWEFEAEWGVDGATCIKNTRWPTILGIVDPKAARVRAYIDAHCRDRWVGPKDKKCGGEHSTFYTDDGYDKPLDKRSLLRTRVSGIALPAPGPAKPPKPGG